MNKLFILFKIPDVLYFWELMIKVQCYLGFKLVLIIFYTGKIYLKKYDKRCHRCGLVGSRPTTKVKPRVPHNF